MIDHSSDRRFSTGVPVSAMRFVASSLRMACVCLACGFLMFCASSRITSLHWTCAQVVHVAPRQAIGADHHVVLLGGLDKLVPARAVAAVVDHHPQPGRKAVDLALPVADHRGRADHQRRADARSGRIGLARPPGHRHWTVCAAVPRRARAAAARWPGSSCPGPCRRPGRRPGPSGAERPARSSRAPGRAATGPQSRAERAALPSWSPPASWRSRSSIQPSVSTSCRGRPSTSSVTPSATPSASLQAQLFLQAFFLPEGDRRLDLVRLEQDPLAAHLHQRHLERGQPLQFLAGQRRVAQGQLPVKLDQRVHVEDAAADLFCSPLARGAHAQPRAGLVPPGRHQHAKAAPFQQRPHLAQKAVRVVDREGARLGAFFAQALADGRKEARRQAQPAQHLLLRVLKACGRAPPACPRARARPARSRPAGWGRRWPAACSASASRAL